MLVKLFAAVIWPIVSIGSVEAATCDRQFLLGLLGKAPLAQESPSIPTDQYDRFKTFVLQESSLGMDVYKYDGVVDSKKERAWIVRYGGIAGEVQWFGPVPVGHADFSGCLDKDPLVGARRNAKAIARPASALAK